MDYQLVFQLKGDELLDFDALVSLEDELQELFEPTADLLWRPFSIRDGVSSPSLALRRPCNCSFMLANF